MSREHIIIIKMQNGTRILCFHNWLTPSARCAQVFFKWSTNCVYDKCLPFTVKSSLHVFLCPLMVKKKSSWLLPVVMYLLEKSDKATKIILNVMTIIWCYSTQVLNTWVMITEINIFQINCEKCSLGTGHTHLPTRPLIRSRLYCAVVRLILHKVTKTKGIRSKMLQKWQSVLHYYMSAQ